jgi:hypothetical protein
MQQVFPAEADVRLIARAATSAEGTANQAVLETGFRKFTVTGGTSPGTGGVLGFVVQVFRAGVVQTAGLAATLSGDHSTLTVALTDLQDGDLLHAIVWGRR